MEQTYSSWLTRRLACPLAALGLLLATAGAAQAQVSFSTPALYATTSNSQGIVTADFNGDGRPDLATANSATSSVSVLLQSGTTVGTFLPAASYGSGGTFDPTLAVGDLNGDGRPDIATIHESSATVGVLLNSATTPGTFAAAVAYGTGNNVGRGIAITDINGDGRLDLITSSGTAVGVLLNSATTPGTFGAPAFYSGGGADLDELMVGDLNGDGRPDVVVGSRTANTVSVLLNSATAPGTLGSASLYTVGNSGFLRGVALGDLNNDGRLDIATSNYSGQSVSVLLNSASAPGTFPATATYSIGSNQSPYGVAIGDVNGDGLADLAASNYNSSSGNTISLFVNSATAPGTFATAPQLYTTGGTGTIRALIRDLNADGRPDLAVSHISSQNVGVLLNATVFAAPTLTSISPNPAAVGTSVTLTGTNLGSATAVRFNGTAATTFAVVNATTITATVPTRATSGPVTVTAGGGTSGGVQFTVLTSAPVLAGIETSVLPYAAGQAPTQLTSTLTVNDADSPNLTGATVAISSGFVAGDGLLFVNQSGITGFYNLSTGVLTLVGTASVATYQAALRAIQFGPFGTPPTTAGDRVVQFRVSDGTSTSNLLTRTVRVVVLPTVATAAPGSITTTSAVLGGSVTADGGDAVTGRGVVYSSTNQTPAIGSAGSIQDVNSSGAVTFAKTIAGLAPGTTYYVRAYATNSAGTSYGSAITFTTLAAPTTVVSLNRASSSPTNASSVSYTLTFAAPVSGLSISNFSLTTSNLSGASFTGLSGSGTTYTVTATTGTGDGTLTLNLANSVGLSPSVSNVPFVGQTYTIDKTAPTVTIASPTAPNGGYTTTSPLTFVVTFSEAVMGYNFANIASNISNAATGTIDASNAPTYTVTLVPAAAGAVTLRVPAGIVTDAAGNANVAAVPPSYTIFYNVPTAAPVVTAPANGSTTATTTPTYQGTAPAGSTVTVYVDGFSIGTTTAPAGSFSLVQPTALTQGSHTVYATAQLSGQAVSANSNANTFTVASAPTITAFSPATGPVGTQVTITGTNLSGATAVRFNGTLASSFVVNSATSLTAVVAAGTSTGVVTVTTPSGTATSATPFVVRVAPTTVADSYSTPQGVTLTGNVLSNDLGTNPRAILITRPANGSLVLNPDGSFSYVPNAGFTGTDSFTYYACDPNLPLLCGNPATVTIAVLRIAPVTVADSYTTPQGVTMTGNVLSNDLGTNPRAILITRTTNGTLVLNPDGSFRYVPNAGFVGTDSFTYYACDPNLPLLCGNPATVTITVTRVAPVTVADSYTTPQGITLTGNVLANDLGTNPRAILINRPTRGTLVLNPDGSFTYVPNAGFSGADSFTYYACNMGAPLVCGDPATVSITVLPASTATRPAAASAKPAATAVGGATIALELALTGHPNPFGDELQLSFSLPIAQAYTLAVYDAQGRLVQQLARGQAEAGQAQQLVVPTHTYAAGLYLVRLTTDIGTRQLKLIKQ